MHSESIQRYEMHKSRAIETASWKVLGKVESLIPCLCSAILARVVMILCETAQQWDKAI